MTPLARVLADTVIRILEKQLRSNPIFYDELRSELAKSLKETLTYQRDHKWKDNVPCEELLRIYEIHGAWWTGLVPSSGCLHDLVARYFIWKTRRKRRLCIQMLERLSDTGP